MIPYTRFHGALGGTAWFQHMTSGVPVECEDVDTVISCYAPRSEDIAGELRQTDYVRNNPVTLLTVGDALAPRTVEEAVLEGFRAAWSL